MKGLVLVPLAAAESHSAYKTLRSEENIKAYDHQQNKRRDKEETSRISKFFILRRPEDSGIAICNKSQLSKASRFRFLTRRDDENFLSCRVTFQVAGQTGRFLGLTSDDWSNVPREARCDQCPEVAKLVIRQLAYRVRTAGLADPQR
jgi:hypothetical protein